MVNMADLEELPPIQQAYTRLADTIMYEPMLAEFVGVRNFVRYDSDTAASILGSSPADYPRLHLIPVGYDPRLRSTSGGSHADMAMGILLETGSMRMMRLSRGLHLINKALAATIDTGGIYHNLGLDFVQSVRAGHAAIGRQGPEVEGTEVSQWVANLEIRVVLFLSDDVLGA